MNPIRQAAALGQSIWLDNIGRKLIDSGELRRIVEEDGILGLTSNPAIFAAAIGSGADYDARIKARISAGPVDVGALYEHLAIADIQDACDILRPAWEKSAGVDGRVSLEVSPYLAHDTEGTVAEAIRLHAAVSRANVMIKVPATPAGVPAIERLIARGISVNVTLLFAVEAYEKVALAYMSGLEAWIKSGGNPAGVVSVASFFVSRIDTLIDARLDKLAAGRADSADVLGLRGKAALANARLAWAKFRDLDGSARWKALAAKGAHPQRLLWASTSVKNPAYPKTMYVDELLGPTTVNTVPDETRAAFLKVTEVRPRITENEDAGLVAAAELFAKLEAVGVRMPEVTQTLLDEAVKKFADPFDQLLATLERKRRELEGGLAGMTESLGSAEPAFKAALEEWRTAGKVRRMWAGDTSVWSKGDEDQWIGWMRIVADRRANLAEFASIAADVKAAGFQQALLLGMGGSSLAPEVWRKTFGTKPGFPELFVLDSTVPAQVRDFDRRTDPKNTLTIVASKSGSTIEPNSFKQHFFARAEKAFGDQAGSRFLAITDPNTKMQGIAERDRFRRITFGWKTVGGRFSALSNFGLVPLAVMGGDVAWLLERADRMVRACSALVPPELNPGVRLGLALGTLAKAGRDKLTVIASPGIGSLGAWLEQLIAESTGKLGKGIVPIDGERLAGPNHYGQDRVFVYERLESAPDAEQDRMVAALEAAGHPVIRLAPRDPLDLGQEMFRWEIATGVAGAVLGINPFDQPDVESAKIAARALMDRYVAEGSLPELKPLASEPATAGKADGITVMADPGYADRLRSAGAGSTVASWLKAHLAQIGTGDYVGLNAYVEMTDASDGPLQSIRHRLRDRFRVATTLGYGPRFLHSTGQLHKGGPNNGVFLQLTCDDAEDLPVPGEKFTFGVLKGAQAAGDMEVLASRGRRILRIHLGSDTAAALERLAALVSSG
jgi:transaldolase/glucose-6-phosphate isomerase